MAGGRPRQSSASEKEERRRQQKRDSYERKKAGVENFKSGAQDRVGDDIDKLEYNAKQREMYERRKTEGSKERGRPRKEDGDDETKKRRERNHRNMSKAKQKLPLNLAFLGRVTPSTTSGGLDDGGPPSILMKSPKRVSFLGLCDGKVCRWPVSRSVHLSM